MFPAIGRLPIRQLTAPHVVQAILAIQKRGAMDVAKRCWNTTGQILRYAVVYGHIDARWEEFDLEAAEWRIPAPVMKMRTPHIVHWPGGAPPRSALPGRPAVASIRLMSGG